MALGIAAILTGRPLRAETQATAPAGGGLSSLDVRVDLKRGMVIYGDTEITIGLERVDFPDEANVVVESFAIGEGRHVVHVRVPARGKGDAGIAWEALLAGGHPGPIFAGRTGFLSGDPGERVGKALVRVEGRGADFAVVGDIREDLHICGQAATLLDPQAVYPRSLELRPATLQRLSAADLARAESVTVTDRGTSLENPIAKLLGAHGSSVDGSLGTAMTDGDVLTSWREDRPGVGQGEFVVMTAPRDVPIARVQMALSPRDAATGDKTTTPRTFYLVTGPHVFQVIVPEAIAQKPGEVFEVAFPHPIETSCLSLVLGDAYAQAAAHPDVGLAEIVAYSEFDSPPASLHDVAKALAGPRAGAAVQVLERADGALDALSDVYDGLSARGRTLAVRVAEGHALCSEAAPLLAHALCGMSAASEPLPADAAARVRAKLTRCPGAEPVLSSLLLSSPNARACVAPILARLAPVQSLEPLADAMTQTPESDAKTRAALRSAFGAALDSFPPGTITAWVADPHRTPAARLEILRAAGARITEAPDASDALVADLLKGAPTLRVRYLLLGPVGILAHAGDRFAEGQIASAIAHDTDWPVRARAAEFAGGLAGAKSALLTAASDDAEPRVREAALSTLTAAPSLDAAHAAMSALSRDDWDFVKMQAVAVLWNGPTDGAVDDALGHAITGPSARVRTAVIAALGHRRATTWRDAIRKRLADSDEAADVRAAAAGALGAICDAASIPALTGFALPLRSVAADEDARDLGFGALAGLAAIHPPDLAARIAPLLAPSAPPAVRTAAEQAVAAPGTCH